MLLVALLPLLAAAQLGQNSGSGWDRAPGNAWPWPPSPSPSAGALPLPSAPAASTPIVSPPASPSAIAAQPSASLQPTGGPLQPPAGPPQTSQTSSRAPSSGPLPPSRAPSSSGPLPPSRAPSPGPLPPSSAPPPSTSSRKRGFVGSGCSGGGCNDAAFLPGLYWYGYNPTDVYHAAGVKDEATLFTPMYHCTSSLSSSPQSGLASPHYVMGFNECNLASQCEMSAQSAAASFKSIMDANPTALLVSPSTAGDGTSWYRDFFAACSSLYGAGGCRISAIAAHAYSCTPSNTMSYLQGLHSTFNLPIWLTEFSCGAHSAGRSTADHMTFMRSIVPLLEAAPYVQRFYWMSARDTSGQRNLVTAGTSGPASGLTPLGQLYLSL